MDIISILEKKYLKFYILHFIFYFIIIIFNFILIKQIIWLKKVLYYLYLSCSYFDLLFFIFPIIPFFLIISKKLKKKYLRLLKQLTLIFYIVSIILGLVFSIVLTINIIESSDFCKDCPFNLPIDQEINESKCKNRICILNYEDLENKYPYEYLCNYNPNKYFEGKEGPFRRKINDTTEIVSDSEIICNKYDFKEYIFQNKIINKYLSICKSVEEFHICQRFLEPKKYNIENNYECPNDNYFNSIYIFCILNLFFNLIISFAPWKLELNIYEKVFTRFRGNNNRISNSFKSTKNSSKILEQIEEGNFKKEPTDLIIVSNNNKNLNVNTNANINNIENDDNNNNVYTIQINPNGKKNNLKKENNIRITEKTDGANQNKNIINNPQNSADIFILDDNRIIKKLKKKK